MKVRIDGAEAMAMYQAAFKRLRALPGFEMKTILLAETGTILKAWAGKTKIAKKETADRRARYRAGQRVAAMLTSSPVSISGSGTVMYRHQASGKRQVAGKVSDNGEFTAAQVHFTNEAWDQIMSYVELYSMQVEHQIELGRDSIGLAQQSVVQCADQLGIDLASVPGGGISSAGVARARAAMGSNGRAYQNGAGAKGGDNFNCFVECRVRLPFGGKIGMDRELAQILARRAKFIETSFKKGAMDSVKRAARAFPNVFRVSDAA